MRQRIAVAAIAAVAVIIAACADQGGGANRLSTEPGGDAEARYITTTSASVLDPRTHQMRVVGTSSAIAPGVSASVAAGGTGGTMQIANGSPGIAAGAGYYTDHFTDQNKHVHTVVLLYGKFGGPPSAVQHYVDGALVSTTGYSWQRTASGWVRTSSIMREVRGNTVVGTYTTTTTTTAPTKPGTPGKPGGPAIPVKLEHQPGAASALERMIGRVAYTAAFAFAPQDASAQSAAFGPCAQEWYKFTTAAIIVIGLTAVISDVPAISPLLASQFAAALATLAAATDALTRCILEHQPPSQFHFFGAGAGSGGSAGGGAGDDDCLEGSYAAHCTTPFTL